MSTFMPLEETNTSIPSANVLFELGWLRNLHWQMNCLCTKGGA